MNPAVIEVENLTKRYGDVEALRGSAFRSVKAKCSACWDRMAPEKPARSKS